MQLHLCFWSFVNIALSGAELWMTVGRPATHMGRVFCSVCCVAAGLVVVYSVIWFVVWSVLSVVLMLVIPSCSCSSLFANLVDLEVLLCLFYSFLN